MSKQTLIDELTKEVNSSKETYQECNDILSKCMIETKIRAYSNALDLANYHIHDGKESVDINHIESVVMNVINDFTAFIKPSREANAFVFDMLKKSICLALQEYNLNGGWISVDDELPKHQQEVLVCNSNSKHFNQVRVAIFEKNTPNSGFIVNGWLDEPKGKITHWQPAIFVNG